MKRMMLVCLMILCLVPLGAWAEEETVEWFSDTGEMYNSRGEHFCFEIENEHAVLTCYWMEAGKPQPPVVEVPAVLGGMPLSVIGDAAFDNVDGIEGPSGIQTPYEGKQVECIVIPEGVTTLLEGAFYCASDVRRIELPTTLAEIQTGLTFRQVEAEIDFPDGNPFYRVENGFLIDTRADALLYCWPATGELPLPRVRRVEDHALENYSVRQTVLEFPDSVEYIGRFNAYDCGDIETIIVPGSVRELADNAFQANSAQEIILNEGLEKIGYWTFADTEITSITFPSTVTWIGFEPFGWWEPEELTVLNPDAVWETEDEYFQRCYDEEE